MSEQPPHNPYPQDADWHQPASDPQQAGAPFPPPSYPTPAHLPPTPPGPEYGPPFRQAPTNPSGFGPAYPVYPATPTGNMWQTNPPGYESATHAHGPGYSNPHTYPPPPPPPYYPGQSPYPGMPGQPGGYPMPAMMGPVPSGFGHPPEGSAIAVEAILAIFGFYGIGWLMSGKTSVGALLLIGGLVWAVIALFIAIFTAGFGLCCLVPIHATFIVLSTVMLARQRVYP